MHSTAGRVGRAGEQEAHIAIFSRKEKNLALQDLTRIGLMLREFDMPVDWPTRSGQQV